MSGMDCTPRSGSRCDVFQTVFPAFFWSKRTIQRKGPHSGYLAICLKRLKRECASLMQDWRLWKKWVWQDTAEWWVWLCDRSSCQIAQPLPYFRKSSPTSCTEYRHIWSTLCAFIFLISLATNSRNTCVTLYKKDTIRNIPDMVCRIAGYSGATNYTQGMKLIWYSSPNITRMIMGETCRRQWSEVECIRNISRETWRKEPLFRPRHVWEEDTKINHRKWRANVWNIYFYWLIVI
jgi:hypothetical protein